MTSPAPFAQPAPVADEVPVVETPACTQCRRTGGHKLDCTERGSVVDLDGDYAAVGFYRVYVDLTREIAGLTAKRDRVREALEDKLGSAHTARIGRVPVLSFKPSKASQTFDAKRFAAEHPDVDLAAYWRDKKQSRPFKLLDVPPGTTIPGVTE